MKTDDLIHLTFEWLRRSAAAIRAAGGDVDAVLSQIPPDLLATLVRNSLVLAYVRKPVL